MYTAPIKSEKEREIERKLTAPVPMLNFSDVPLKDVVKELQATQGINIFLDQRVAGTSRASAWNSRFRSGWKTSR